MKLHGYQIDSFTDRPFSGNPAGVIANAEGLTATQMQMIAREFNNSETAFILPPEGPDHNVLVRFFTPTTEVPSCGHATIAAHFVRALESKITDQKLVQKTGAGLMPISINSYNGQLRIAMTQNRPAFERPLGSIQSARILRAIGAVKNTYLDLPIQVVSTGHSKVMIPLANKSQIDQLKPDLAELSALSDEIGCNGYFVFCLDDADGDDLVYGRMFAPAIGIAEDPVTGNANGPVGAYLVRCALAPDGNKPFRFSAVQGVAMGRPGRVHVEVERDGRNPTSVTISGSAVQVFKTEFDAP